MFHVWNLHIHLGHESKHAIIFRASYAFQRCIHSREPLPCRFQIQPSGRVNDCMIMDLMVVLKTHLHNGWWLLALSVWTSADRRHCCLNSESHLISSGSPYHFPQRSAGELKVASRPTCERRGKALFKYSTDIRFRHCCCCMLLCRSYLSLSYRV